MFKLVDFLQKKKKEGGKESRKKSGASTLARPPPALKLNRREKQEIRATLKGFQGSEAHDILMAQLAEHDIVEEIVAEDAEDDSSYSSGTFCVRSIGDSGEAVEEEEEEEEEQNYGTFCVNSFSSGGAEEEESKPSFLSGGAQASSSPATPKKSKKRKGSASSGGSGASTSSTGSAPDFSNMFREPEDWEKCILSLEKGEWTDQMESKGAFKRWKKERPAMPSAYLKSSPFSSGDMFAPPESK